MNRLISRVSTLAFVSLLTLNIQASDVMAAEFQQIEVQQPPKAGTPVTPDMARTTNEFGGKNILKDNDRVYSIQI